MAFYIDTCIYLNLWQKEEIGGKKLWKIAEDFLQKIEEKNTIVYFSGFVLKELKFVLTEEEFNKKRALFNDAARFKMVIASVEDYDNARKLESESKFDISFFDCMHIVLSKKANAMLVTRDRKLIDFAKKHWKVARPEELL